MKNKAIVVNSVMPKINSIDNSRYLIVNSHRATLLLIVFEHLKLRSIFSAMKVRIEYFVHL
jgi:hypothetical protein